MVVHWDCSSVGVTLIMRRGSGRLDWRDGAGLGFVARVSLLCFTLLYFALLGGPWRIGVTLWWAFGTAWSLILSRQDVVRMYVVELPFFVTV